MTAAASPKVLVLGKEDRAFLAVVRSLGRKGIRVHLAWCPSDALARESRYVERVHDLPPYSTTNDAWKRAFLELCRAERFDLVMPTNDSTIIPLQTHRDELEPHVRIYLLPRQTYDVAFDKDKVYALAQRLGVNLPRQIHVPLPATPEAVLERLPLPLVLKPRASFNLEDIGQKQFVRKVFTRDELVRDLEAFRPQGEVWAQEYFEGVGMGVEGLAADGEVLACLQHMRIHERRMGGADSYRKTIPLHPEMHRAFVEIMRALKYTGVGMLEFKCNLATGRWVLLEMNARFWASLPVAVAAGGDYPYWLYQLLVEGKRDFPQQYRANTYCRNWGRDLLWIKENFEAPPAEQVPVGTLLREIGPILTLREHSDTFVIDDPRPGLVDLGRLLVRARNVTRRVTRETLARVGPLRKLRAVRLRRALRRADSVLFVCKGNICRSPFAEAYARAALNGRRVLSAGYYPKQGRPCPEPALAAARELGVDLGPHRSTLVSEDLVRRAGVIFVFDQENWLTMTTRFPFARGKIHRLAYLAENGTPDIRDPYGRPVDDFRAAYRRIRSTLDAALPQ